MDIRKLTVRERGLAAELWRYCFADTQEFVDWYFSRRVEDVLAFMDGGDLAAQIVCVPLTLSMRGAAREAMMLSGVATAPGRRGKGLMTGLMRECLAYLRDKGVGAAVLYPYDYSFYEQYGFAKCGETVRVRAPIDRLPAVRLQGDVFPLNGGEGDCAALARAYEASFARYSGHVLRDEAYFSACLEELAMDEGYGAVYRREGREEGYIFYGMRDKVFEAKEIGAASRIAGQDLLGFIRSHSSTMETVEFLCPLEDPLWRLLPDARGLASVEPYAMARIVDLGRALNGLPAGEGEVTLQIRDAFAPWNDGVWRLSAKDGKLAADRAPDHEAADAPSLSIGSLTRRVFGCVGESGLPQEGGDLPETPARAIDGLLPERPFFLYEMY